MGSARPNNPRFQPVGVGLAIFRSNRRSCLGLWFIRRWSAKKREDKGTIADSELLTRVRNEAASDKTLDLDPEDSSPRAQLLQERDRLYAELKELQFDFQAGKLAASDYATLKLEIENKAAECSNNSICFCRVKPLGVRV